MPPIKHMKKPSLPNRPDKHVKNIQNRVSVLGTIWTFRAECSAIKFRLAVGANWSGYFSFVESWSSALTRPARRQHLFLPDAGGRPSASPPEFRCAWSDQS